MKVTVRFGVGNQLTRTFPQGSTINSVLTDRNVQAVLGFSTNVEGYVHGVPQPGTTLLVDGMTIDVNNKACEKAVS